MLLSRSMLGVVAALSLCASEAVFAEAKIAFVEIGKVLESSPQVKSVQEKLKKEFANRDADLVSQQQQVKKLRDQLSSNGGVMSDSESKKLERDIVARTRTLKTKQGEFQEDLALRQNEELGKLRKVIAEVIIEVAKKDGYDLVLEGGVVWASDKINITDTVISRLKSK
jgi:outer membrane protein